MPTSSPSPAVRGVFENVSSADLAAALTRQGLRVLVLDADLGLANLDVVLNLYPKITLHDVFTGRATLADAVRGQQPSGFHVLLAGSGMVEYSRLTTEVRNQLICTIDSHGPALRRCPARYRRKHFRCGSILPVPGV